MGDQREGETAANEVVPRAPLDLDRYRQLFRHAPVGQVIYDREARIVEANDAFHAMLGYEQGELVGVHVLSLTHPDDRHRTRDRLVKTGAQDDASYTMEKRYVRKDGRPVWVRLSVDTVLDVDGQPDYYIALISDLTERLEREELLRLAEQQFRGVFAHAPIGLAICDADATILDANPELSRILMRPRKELLGRRIDALRPPEDLVVSPTDTGALLDGTTPMLTADRRFVRRDGAMVHTRITMTLLNLESAGHPQRIVALVEDVTAQRRAEWERELADRRYRTMFEDAAIGQIIATLTGEVVEANRQTCRTLDRGLEQVIGHRIVDFFHPDEEPLPADELRGLLFGDIDELVLERRLLRDDGGVVHGELHIAMGVGASGGPEHLVIQVLDITERRAAEQRLAATLEELEIRNQDLEHFASVASHDLKTPLQTVHGFLELLQFDAEELDETQQMYVQRALNGSNRMRALIDAVLNFARSGVQALDPVPLQLGDVLGSVQQALRSSLEDHDGDVELTDGGELTTDQVALEIVLQNLVSNGLKYHREDVPPKVQVSLERRGRDAIIRVSDNGRGISPEEREDAFEMFQRVASSKGVTGSGIGLTTCRRLVDRLGGRMWIEASPLGGTTVAVSLPQPD